MILVFIIAIEKLGCAEEENCAAPEEHERQSYAAQNYSTLCDRNSKRNI